MKKQFLKTSSLRTYTVAIATALLLSSLVTVNASDKNINSGDAKITYVGVKNNMTSFNIKFKNESEVPFVLELTDEEGRVIYKEKTSLKAFDKNILLKTDGDNMLVSFTIRSGRKSLTQKFDINTIVTEVEQLEVTSL